MNRLVLGAIVALVGILYLSFSNERLSAAQSLITIGLGSCVTILGFTLVNGLYEDFLSYPYLPSIAVALILFGVGSIGLNLIDKLQSPDD